MRTSIAITSLLAGLTACESEELDPGPGGGGSGGDLALVCQEAMSCNAVEPGDRSCTLPADWYTPGADDAWPACDGADQRVWNRIDPNVSTIARIGAFETMADLLWEKSGTPTKEDFEEAVRAYGIEEGLGSRVARREDMHHPGPPDGKKCTDEGVPAQHPERCVGPAVLAPLINDAFRRGIAGQAPEVQAARLEAALLWFLHISVHKEALTCATTPKDCDSSWAYYAGGQPEDQPLGLGRYVAELSPETHHDIHTGLFALRCWRSVDQAAPAERTDLRDRAVAQLDDANVRGILLVARERLQRVSCSTGVEREAAGAFLHVLVPFLDRPARAIDPAAADALAAAVTEQSCDVDAAIEAIDALVAACP